MDPITDRTSKPFIHPSEVQPNGKLKPLTQAEEVLNWQSENMVSQNEILQNIDKKVHKIAEKIDKTDEYLKRKGENQRCFICGKRGHFSKECPNNTYKAAKLINSLHPLEGDLESLYYEQIYADEETIFALQDSSSNEASFSELEDDRYLPVYSFKEIGISLPTPLLPCVEFHVLATKFSRLKKVIAYMDTGAQITMMNPSIFPAESWLTHVAYFVAVDGKVFKTDLVTKEKIGIKFFPDCIVWTRVIGNNLPNKDIVVGMDVYSATSRLQVLPTGIKFKRDFKPYSGILKLHSLSKIHVGYEEIKSNLLKLCADNHEIFFHPKPLWKNKDSFCPPSF
ncbi:hypothetical protein KIW84_032731 [Lathyrus oleraceus]|uniref:CCHC-type domain-containing protein n=1 Tax=Pisum sativum TaxID=3888 RepID=A0A9D4XVN2_PEA|nr:hypothetical protein KIW84_032731 [Pisum sativum]